MTELLLGHQLASGFTMDPITGQAVRERKPVTVPLDVATQTIGVIARRGAGKTYFAGVLCEEMLENGVQIVIIDPLNAHHGLRTLADGKTPGYEIVLFGGDDGDLPLDYDMGERIAELVVREGFSAIFNIDPLDNAKKRIFVTAFLERLYNLRSPQPIHVVVDEADLFMPQKSISKASGVDLERMLEASNNIVRRGRSRGLGMTMITQRPAVIAKDVLTQIEVLITLQLTSPQDRKAVKEWVDAHDTEGQADKFMSSLAGLRQGQAWIWSPSWLNIFCRCDIRKKRTFDSSFTPKVGAVRVKATAAARPDLQALRKALTGVIEEHDANDPVKLHAKISSLESKVYQLEAKQGGFDESEVRKAVAEARFEARKERDYHWQGYLKGILNGKLDALGGQVIQGVRELFSNHPVTDAQLPLLDGFAMGDKTVPGMVPGSPWFNEAEDSALACVQRDREIWNNLWVPAEKPKPINLLDNLSKGERLILGVLKQHGGKAPWNKVALLAGYKPGSSTMRNLASQLRVKELIDQGSNMSVGFILTAAGSAAAGDVPPLPRGPKLRDFWLSQVSGGVEREMLKAFFDRYPNSLSKGGLETIIGTPAESSTMRNALSHLNVMGLITGRGDERKASDDLFR